MKLSNHSKMRMRERTPFNHKERRDLFRLALKKGKNPQDVKDPKLREYLVSKQNRNGKLSCYIKLYRDYLFFYSKTGKQLYTMYKVPERFLENKEESGDEGAL